MRKRFVWSILFSILAIGILIPINILLVLDGHTLADQARANFITILIVEGILIFGVAFAIINEYFNIHSDYQTLVFRHKISHPEIPINYYKNSNESQNRQVDAAEKEIEESAAATRTENKTDSTRKKD